MLHNYPNDLRLDPEISYSGLGSPIHVPLNWTSPLIAIDIAPKAGHDGVVAERLYLARNNPERGIYTLYNEWICTCHDQSIARSNK